MTLDVKPVRGEFGQLIGHTWRVPSGGFRGKRIGGYAMPFKALDRYGAIKWVVSSHRDAAPTPVDDEPATAAIPYETMTQLVHGTEAR
jgi:hypothetical protein